MRTWKCFMKRTLGAVLAASLIAGSGYGYSIPANAQDGILYEEDFSTLSTEELLKEWVTDKTGASMEVADDADNKVMHTSATDKVSSSVYWYKELGSQNTGKLKVSFDFKAGQTTGSAAYMTLSGGTENVIQFQVHNNGKVVWNKGNSQLVTLLDRYEADQWYNVEIEMDLNKKNADIYIEGERVCDDEAFNTMKTAGVDKLGTAVAVGSSNCDFWFDNFKVVKTAEVPPMGITVSQDTATLQPNGKLQLSAQVTPEDADCKVVWSSDDEEVAQVSADGMVTGISAGSANITASVDGYGELKAACEVTVEEKSLPWIEDFQADKYVVGEAPADWPHTGSEQVSFKIADDNGNKVLSVDSNGELPSSEESPHVWTDLPLISEGRMLLSMKVYPYTTEGVGYLYMYDSLGNKVMQINIGQDGKIQINEKGTPQNIGSYEAGKWQTIGFIFDMGTKSVDLLYEGDIVKSGITSVDTDDIAQLSIGSARAYTTKFMVDDITVYKGPEIVPDTLELTRQELSMRAKETKKLDYTVTPEQAYGSENIIYESDNDKVASVAADGTVTANAPGTANIKVYCTDKPEIADTCKVEVKKYGIDKIFFVAPDGKDTNDGGKDAPFQTAGRAAEEVAKYNRDMKGDIIVFFREGIYTFDETWNIDQTLSGTNGYSISFKAYRDETVIFSGGMQVTGWKEMEDGSGIWYATLDQDIETRQMYVNGEMATRARSGSGLPDATWDSCTSPDQAVGHTTSDTSMVDWKNQKDIEMVYNQNWTNPRCGVENITLTEDGNKAKIQMQQPGYYFCRNKMSTSTQNPWFIENAYELLDTPGEWYLDETGDINPDYGKNTFYYMPQNGENMKEAEVIVPVLTKLVDIKGTLDAPVKNIKFEGISFRHSTWLRPGTDRGLPDAQNNIIREYDPSLSISNHLCREYIADGAVNFQYTENLEFTGCDFRNIGTTALVGSIGCNDTIIRNNNFTKLSGGGVHMGEVDMYREEVYSPSDERYLIRNTLIENNTFKDVANEYRSSSAIGAGFPSNITVSHNTISDIPYSGIHIGWGWEKREAFATKDVKILDNHIYNCMTELHDGGAIYTLGYTSSSAYKMNLIQGNYVHDQYNEYGLLYLDEGADYYSASGNVFSTANKPELGWLLHKHNTNKVFDNYIDSENDRPECTDDNFYVGDGNWPAEAQEIMSTAGVDTAAREPVNEQGLESLLAEADTIQNEEDFEPDTWAAFVQARQNARAVLESTYTESDLEEQWYYLYEAMENLQAVSGAEKHQVIIGEMDHGTVNAEPTEAAEGECVTLTVTPDKGYVLKDGTLLADGVAVENLQFTMPAHDVIITAEFVEKEQTGKPGEPENPDESEQEDGSNGNKDEDAPNTGDTEKSSGAFAATAASLLVILAVGVYEVIQRRKMY